jgi:hypothetical protein
LTYKACLSILTNRKNKYLLPITSPIHNPIRGFLSMNIWGMTMRNLFFERLKRKIIASTVYLFCVFMMVMFTGGCASQHKKETTLKIPAPPSFSELSVSHAKETGQASEKGESVNGKNNDDQEIVCRRIPVTGSRISKRICATNEQWAFWSKKRGENVEEFNRYVIEESRRNTTDAWAPVSPSPGPF